MYYNNRDKYSWLNSKMSSKKVKTVLMSLLISSYRMLSGKGRAPRDMIDTKKIKKIAIFSTTALGDFMFNTPVICAIQEKYPFADITLVSSYKNKELVESCSWFSRVLFWDQKVHSLPKLISLLRKDKPDLVVLLHSKTPYDVLCATLCGASYILKDAYNATDLIMRKLVTYMTNAQFNGHLIERKMSLLSILGCNTANVNMKIPFSYNKLVKKESIITIGFQLGASEKVRQWPISHFQALAKLILTQNDNYRIALIGSPQEKELSRLFISGLTSNEQSKILDYVGKVSLTGLVETISGFDLLITGDTGPLHLAVALQVKTISLFVTANPAYTGPLQDPQLHQVIYLPASTHCEPNEQPMVIIEPSQVMLAIIESIAKERC